MWLKQKLQHKTLWGQLKAEGAVQNPLLRLADPGSGQLALAVMIRFLKQQKDNTHIEDVQNALTSLVPKCVETKTWDNGLVVFSDGSALICAQKQNTKHTLVPVLLQTHAGLVFDNKTPTNQILATANTIKTAFERWECKPQPTTKGKQPKLWFSTSRKGWEFESSILSMLRRKRLKNMPANTLAFLASVYDIPKNTPLSVLGSSLWQNGDVLPPCVLCEDDKIATTLNTAYQTLAHKSKGPWLEAHIAQTVLEGIGPQPQILLDTQKAGTFNLSAHQRVHIKKQHFGTKM